MDDTIPFLARLLIEMDFISFLFYKVEAPIGIGWIRVESSYVVYPKGFPLKLLMVNRAIDWI